MTVQSSGAGARPMDRDYPTGELARRIYSEQLLQRAVEAYRFFYPTASMEALMAGQRALGIEDNASMMILAAGPRHMILTSNSDTPYAAAVLDLATAGPIVIEIPAGPYVGLVNDHDFRWIVDVGMPGPDGGRGGRYVVLPPGFTGNVTGGAHVVRASTNKVLLALRAIPGPDGLAGALEALRRVKLFPIAKSDAVLELVDVTSRAFDTTPVSWEDNLEIWRRLHAVLQVEHAREEFRPMYGELASLGIVKGYPFPTDRELHALLERAARIALQQMRIAAFASGRPDRVVWPDRKWEWVGLSTDPNFETSHFMDLEARDRWFFQAIAASPAMFRRQPGAGSIYFLAARDANGEYLDGSKTYELSVPLPVPASLFWSVTAYDAHTRAQIQTPQDKAVLGSLQVKFPPSNIAKLVFGPSPPKGGEQQWIQTKPGQGFFLYFRVYGPEAACFDGKWRPGDLKLVSTTS